MKLVILLMFLLVGCSDSEKPKLHNYVCTPEQLERVKEEYEVCSETGYFLTYCFAQAKATQCDKKVEK